MAEAVDRRPDHLVMVPSICYGYKDPIAQSREYRASNDAIYIVQRKSSFKIGY